MGKKDEWVNLKPTNAVLPVPTRVRLTGLVQASNSVEEVSRVTCSLTYLLAHIPTHPLTDLVQAAQYNGRIVKIVRTDLEAGRYEVTMFEDEDTKLVPKVRARVPSCTLAAPLRVLLTYLLSPV